MTHPSPRSAFTLVELAIVLVIIGLIVGGVLVGQDLIKAAQIRSVITDIEKYNAAASTFREKYTGLPGDLLNTKALQFGFNTAANDPARDGTANHGDGNGFIQGCSPWPNTATILGCENSLFWVDLSHAGLIPMRTSLTSVTAIEQADSSGSDLASGILPSTRLRSNALVAISTRDGGNYFNIGEFSTDGSGQVLIREGGVGGVTPLEAQTIDTKLDDAYPSTGVVALRYKTLVDFDAVQLIAAGCMNNDGQYQTTTDEKANDDTCAISIRASF